MSAAFFYFFLLPAFFRGTGHVGNFPQQDRPLVIAVFEHKEVGTIPDNFETR